MPAVTGAFMSVTLDDQTVALIESRMKEFGFDSADELIKVALDHLGGEYGVDYESLDAETRASIEEGEAEYQRGEGRRVEEVREELMRRFRVPESKPQ
jgi:Arc/MetJ-type ribon-helix-helix transcriptional regulator